MSKLEDVLNIFERHTWLQFAVPTTLMVLFFLWLMLTPIMDMQRSTIRDKEQRLLDSKQHLVDTIDSSAKYLCNFDDIDKQDVCISRLADRYVELIKEVK